MAFMTDLSEHLSHRYARPISSIAVTLQHGVCLLMGGSLEPAYIVAIHALPGLVQTATNKRNAALLQRHLLGALGVVPARGMIRFVGVPEECLAVGGRTVAGELAGERTGVEGRRVQRRRTVRVCYTRQISGSLGVFGGADGDDRHSRGSRTDLPALNNRRQISRRRSFQQGQDQFLLYHMIRVWGQRDTSFGKHQQVALRVGRGWAGRRLAHRSRRA